MEYTREQVDKMGAGPEIDALIAKHIRNWEFLEVGYWKSSVKGIDQLPDSSTAERQLQLRQWLDQEVIEEITNSNIGEYWIDEPTNFIMLVEDFKPSTDIAAAIQLIERFHRYRAELVMGLHDWAFWTDPHSGIRGRGLDASIPLAICKAALKAIL